MSRTIRRWSLIALLVLFVGLAARPASAQSPQPPVTTVMATLKLTPGTTRDSISKVMPEEVRRTLELYLDGRITQWYSRGDGTGVVFMINATSVDAAKAITDGLPLVKNGFATFDFVTLTPLNPLRLLLAPPAAVK